MKNSKIFWIISIAVILLDQLTKFLIKMMFEPNQSLHLIRNILNISYIRNTGAAFGILQNMQPLLVMVSIAAIAIIFYNYKKITSEPHISAFAALILGGAVGNLIDRIFLGYIIDFIDFIVWPAFNIADSALTIGAIGLAIHFMKEK